MTIVEFLEARITEDEAFITAPRGFTGHEVHLSDPIGAYSPRCPTCVGVHSGERMKAECAAKRAIIGEHEPVDYSGFGMVSPNACSLCGADHGMHDWEWEHDSFPCHTLKALAAVYKAHPDYNPEWEL